MKSILLIIICLVISANSFSQMNAKAALRIKKSDFSIDLLGNKMLDSSIVKAINNYWSFTDKNKFIQNKSIQDKEEWDLIPKMTFYKHISEWDGYFKETALGSAIIMHIKIDYKWIHVGFDRFSTFSFPDFVEIIKRAQFIMSEIIIEGNWIKAYSSTKKKYGKELKNKTLLVNKQLLEENLNLNTFKSIYPYNFKFVDKDEIDKAILENDSSKAYIIISEEKVGIFVQYICDAGTGKIYTHKHSVIQTKSSLKNKTFNKYVSVSDIKTLSKRIK